VLARYFHGRRLDERLVMERQDTADVDNDSNTFITTPTRSETSGP